MTIETAYAASVLSPNPNSVRYATGYHDKSGNGAAGGMNMEPWTNQSSGSIGVNQFNATSGDYAQCAVDSKSDDEGPYWILLYDYAANLSLTSGDTITDTIFTLSRVQGGGTGSNYYLYDWIVQAWIYNGTDFTTGGQGSILANTSSNWPQISGTGPTSGNFSTASYDFTTGPTYSNLTNSDWGVMLAVDGSQTFRSSTAFINSGEITVTYTAGSTPSPPTGLTLTYVSPTELAANWTNPSGTLTDNTIQLSTDASTWTTTDIGSVVTTYNLTGLTPSTVYYAQVAAVNSNGTGSYSSMAVNVTQPTNSQTVTLEPSTDSLTTGWTNNGGAASFSAALSDASDTTYVSPPASISENLQVSTTSPPAGFICVTAVAYNVRAKTSNAGDTNSVLASINRGTFSLLAASTQLTASLTTSFANYTVSNVPLNGTQTFTDWRGGGVLFLTAFDTNQDCLVAEASVTITYLIPADLPVPLVSPAYLGVGACPFGVTNQMRKNHVEGVRFQHRNA